jgi:tetratricopeptide (TPR) repeat protein
MKKPAKRSSASTPIRWIWLTLGICVVVFALVASIWKPSRTQSKISSSPADEERALCAEQLQAAEKLVAMFPQSDDAVYLLGLVHNEQGDSDTAIKHWQRSLELDATRADANDSLGHAFLLRDEYEKAEAYLRKALAIEPTLATANFRLASSLVHQSKMREAADILEKANSLSAEGHRLLGEAYQHLKEYAKARASYEAALTANTNLAEAYYGLSKVMIQLGDEEKSRGYWEKFSALKQQKDQQAREVRATYDPLSITKRSVAKTHTDVGRVYIINNRPKEAEELWLRAAALDSANTLCRLQLAIHYHQTERYSQALQYYQDVARADPNDALLQLNIGRVCLKLNQPSRAEEAFKKVVELAPDRPEGHAALAQARQLLAQGK